MTNNVLVSGIKAAGSTLKAKLDVAGATNVSYAWVAVAADGTTNVLSTLASYKLTDADVSKTINVVASYKTAAGLQTATHTGVLADLNQQHTGGISIKGATTVGSTLSIASTLVDKDGLDTFTYTWKVGNTTVANNNTSTYTIGAGDEGKQISAVVTYTDKHGFTETSNNPITNQVSYSTVKSALNDHLAVTTAGKVVTGGLGADTFIFSAINNKAFKIGDFSTSQSDKLDLSAIDANLSVSGNQSFAFGAKPTTGPAEGALWFDSATSTLYGSVDSDIDAEFSVVLTGVTRLTATDFVAL